MRTRRILTAILLAATLTAVGCKAEKLRTRGDRALTENLPVQAVRYYEQALDEKPTLANDERFVARMAEAKRLAASRLHSESLAAAAAGELSKAGELVDEALRMDASNPRAQASQTALLSPMQGPAGQKLAAAGELIREKQWDRAAAALEAAVREDPNHLPARAELHRVNTVLSEVRGLMNVARARTNQKRYADAAEALQKVLAIWPDHPSAAENLGGVQAQMDRADRAYQTAAADAKAGQWEKALVEASAALAIYPGHRAAAELDSRARGELAAARTDAGRAAMRASNLDEADRLFTEAMRYRPDYPSARQGLSKVAGARGSAAAAQGRHGAALLWYRRASAMSGNLAFGGELAAQRRAVQQRIGYDLAVTSTGEGGPAAAAGIVARLVRQRPEHVGLAARPADDTPYVIHATVVRSDAVRRQVSSEIHEKVYIVRELGPNPRLGDLHRAILDARQRLAQMRRQYDLQTRGQHEDRARPRDRRGDISEQDIRRQALLVQRLEREMRTAPRQVSRDVEARWPFRVDTWEIRATLELQVQILSGGRVVDTFRVARAATQSDETIDRPNPQIGLPPDPLELATTEDVSAELLSAVSVEAADQAVAAVEKLHHGRIGAAADARARQGDAAGALESRVDAAVLLSATDPNGGGQALDALDPAGR